MDMAVDYDADPRPGKREPGARQVMSAEGYRRWRMRADGWRVVEEIPGGGMLLVRD